MMHDTLRNWKLYARGQAAEKAIDFVTRLNPECAIGEYPIMGGTLFAKVIEPTTMRREETVCEAHRKFIDLQVILKGEEYVDVYHTPDLTVKTPYNPETDVEFFEIPEIVDARVKLKPGNFAVFFPDDAHVPLIMTGSEPTPLKICVIKMDVDLYHGRHPDYS